jgi:hypothetical protein
MYRGVNLKSIVKTSIVTSFTIAAGFIWRDVIIEGIELVVPPGDELIYKVAAACLATIVVIISIYVFLRTEDEAEHLYSKYKRHYEKTTKKSMKKK